MARSGFTRTRVNAAHAIKTMQNVMNYNSGYAEGLHANKEQLMTMIGAAGVQAAGQYVDKMAAGNPDLLHHVYEWSGIGQNGSRLFSFSFVVGPSSVSFVKDEFRQSSEGAPAWNGTKSVPFGDKARVFEEVGSVKGAKPGPNFRKLRVVRRTPPGWGESGPVSFVDAVGTRALSGKTYGAFQRVVDTFFSQFVTQAFLAPVLESIANSKQWQANFAAGGRGGGRAAGVAAATKQLTYARTVAEGIASQGALF